MNVICLLTDTFRRDHMGAYKRSDVKTPSLDAFANRSVVFENSYMGSYPCMPARMDFLTGRFNFLWKGWSPLEYTDKDLVTMIRNHQKKTMLITDHFHLWHAGAGNYHYSYHGMEFIRGQENDNWITDPDIDIRWPAPPEKLARNWVNYAKNTAHFKKEEDYFTPDVFGKAIDWIDRNKNLDDFFLMIDCFDPHEPFDPPQEYADMYNPGYEGDSVVWPSYGKADRFSEEELKQIQSLYKGEITLVDKWFGKMIDKLESLNLLEDTMVIVTSDHGFLFGEHNWVGKHSKTLYNHITHTPLMIYHPNGKPGRNKELVQMADLYPTILDAFDIELPEGIHGRSLLPYIIPKHGKEENRDYICYGVYGGAVYVTDGEWVYVKRPVNDGPLYWYTDSHYQIWDFGQNIDIDASRELRQKFEQGRFPATFVREELNDAVYRSEEKLRERYQIKGGDALTLKPVPDELYNLVEDYEQTTNLAEVHKEKAEEMKKYVIDFIEKINAPKEQLTRLGLEN